MNKFFFMSLLTITIEKDQIGAWKHVLRGYDAGK
jgi:hypothetical protein